MRGPLAAALIVASFAYAGLMFAPSLVPSAALVALVVLRHGLAEGLKVAAMASAAVTALALLTFGKLGIAALVVVAPWGPIAAAAWTLRASGSQGRAVALLGVFIGVFAATVRQSVPDVDAFWRERLEALGDSVKAQGGQFLTREEIASFASLVHPGTVGAITLCLVGALLLARWWQSCLFRPGAFGEEFRVLRLPLWVFPAGLAASAGAWFNRGSSSGSSLLGDVGLVLVLLFAVQGLAIAHERVLATGGRRGWLVGMYTVLGLVPHVAITALAATGAADFLADFRRLRRPPPAQD